VDAASLSNGFAAVIPKERDVEVCLTQGLDFDTEVIAIHLPEVARGLFRQSETVVLPPQGRRLLGIAIGREEKVNEVSPRTFQHEGTLDRGASRAHPC
jgi:hypothetical protein